MYSCYIIDDDSYCIDALEGYINKITYLVLLKSFTNPLLALDEIRLGFTPDIVFLNIDMSQLSGLVVADLLPKHISVVFSSGHSKYALNAFEKDALGFLLKPYSFENFVRTVTNIKDRRNLSLATQTIKSIFINPGVKGKVVQIFLTDIISIEAKDHFIGIKTRTETIHSKMSLTEFMEKLTQVNFIKVHRSFIINIDFIKSIEHNKIILNTDLLIPLSLTYKTELLNRIKHRTIKAL